MSREWGILHLTDFHVAEPSAGMEHLREGFYREYIDDLAKALETHVDNVGKTIDAIVITGDFVDRGALCNFSHVEKIIEYLCSKLRISTKRVFVCNGNHDIDRDLEIATDIEGARKSFKQFRSSFGNELAVKENNRFSLVKTEFQTHMLMIDSTLGSSGVDRPGTISTTEIDEILEAIRLSPLSEDELLVIATHHPACPYIAVDAPFDESNMSWPEQHLWQQAYPLYSRLGKRVNHPILWLSGDIHRPAHVIEGPIHSVATGRFGTPTNRLHTQIKRQGRVIYIGTSGETQSWLLEFAPTGHTDQAQLGHWEITEKQTEVHTRSTRGSSRLATTPSTPSSIAETSADVPQRSDEVTAELTADSNVQIFSDLLQEMLLGEIARERLYSLGRYSTSETESTLAWIPMGSLLDQGDILSAVITKMTQWVKKQLIDEESTMPVIVGIDSWGAILASQISAMTGVKNYCVAGRAGGITHAASERISETVKAGILGCDMLFLVSDVVGTGKSLARINAELTEDMTDNQKRQIKCSLLSVICDEGYQRGDNLKFAFTNATACKDLRMPILRNDQLPNEAILPADISFIRR